MTSVAIVGGGITGMAAADTLSRKGIACTIFEQDGVLGGLAGSFKVDGVYLEKFYHHLFTSDTAMAGLIERLGLGDKLEWVPTTHSYYVNRIFRLSTPLDLLRFKHISLLDRLLLGLALHPHAPDQGLAPAGGHHRARVADQDGRAPGVREGLGAPDASPSSAIMPTRWPRCGSGTSSSCAAARAASSKRSAWATCVGGFGQALEAWEKELRARGVEMRLGEAVERVAIEEGRATGVVTA